MNKYLSLNKLTKEYAPGKGAKNIDLDIHSGEIVGFLGPNGAGKTTTMKLITNQIKPQSGSLEIFGKDIKSNEDYVSVASGIGYMPSDGGIYEDLNALELINLAAKLQGKAVSQAEITKLADDFKLDLLKPIKKLSLGNRKKASLLQAIITRPKLIILDEPTSGLDPLIQKLVLAELAKLRSGGSAILLSSHVLAEVEAICDRIVIIKQSEIVFDGKTSEALEKALRRLKVINPNDKLVNSLSKMKGLVDPANKAGEFTALISEVEEVIKHLVAAQHFDFYIERTPLEETFLSYYKAD